MTLIDFLPYVLPRAKGCAQPIAIQAIRLAIIELCKRTRVWKEFQAEIDTVADQTSYAYSPAAGQQVVHLLSLTLDGVDVGVKDPLKGRMHDGLGTLTNYAYGKLSGFELRPAPSAAGLKIVTYAAVAPSLTAATVPDAFGQYIETIAKGALYRLFSSPELECANSGAAVTMKGEFEDECGTIQVDAMTGGAASAPRTSPHWF